MLLLDRYDMIKEMMDYLLNPFYLCFDIMSTMTMMCNAISMRFQCEDYADDMPLMC